MSAEISARLLARLQRLYGPDRAPDVLARIVALAEPASKPRPPLAESLSERDIMLITYGDQVMRPSEAPLATLHHFLRAQLGGLVNSVHILPFYPYTSDDGFSVVDYTAVNPALGDWSQVEAMSADFRLMFDAVFNHISASSAWFQGFLRGEAPYRDYFTTADPRADLSAVVRPRTLPLLTPFETPSGTQHVWTTFSADQIDLNVANPEVLLELLRVLLVYVRKGATFIRLDAIAFIWKRIGTSCIHLEEVHLIVQVMRDFLDLVAPSMLLITETNVPHHENITYFGDGTNEAQMVYQFALPPLTLHTLRAGDARALTRWAAGLSPASAETTFFNFLASHDGIGVRPVAELLSEADRAALVQMTLDHGGRVSYRSLPDGGQSPYELNISYFDAITHPEVTATAPEMAIKRFLVSQAMMLALAGVPGIYFHSLFGSRSDHDGLARLGHNRAINRQKLALDALETTLRDPASLRAQVFAGYARLLRARISHPAFHPLGAQHVHDLHPAVFAVERRARDTDDARVLAVHNVSDDAVTLRLPEAGNWRDLLSGHGHDLSAPVTIPAYGILWLASLAG